MATGSAEALVAIRELSDRMAAQRAERQARRALDPRDFESLRLAGFQRLVLPEAQGGLWRDARSGARHLSRALSALARGDSSVALVAAMHPAVLSYWLTAPERRDDGAWQGQLREIFGSIASTGSWWGTITSEPASGGDVRRTRAIAKRGAAPLQYLLSGEKHFGSGSGVTSFMVTSAIPEGEAEPDWYFLDMRRVPWDGSRGVKLLAEWDGLGMAATQSHAFRFDGFPATRIARPGHFLEVSRRAGPFIACLFTSVIAGVVEIAVEIAAERLRGRALSAFESTEWARARMEAWLIDQALEGMLRAVEEREEPRLETLQGKVAAAELAESVLTRLCRFFGGGSFSRRSPFSHWFEDVRALGFLRPPWALAFETLAELSANEVRASTPPGNSP